MALFPPEFLAGVLLAFLQLRLRSHCSLAAWLLSGLSFFLPPEDELIATLNGKNRKPPTPLSPQDKMAAFYIRAASTEPGVFAQTLFFELFEMLVVVASSALGAVALGDLFALIQPLIFDSNDDADASRPSMAAYALLAALLVAVWFPLQLQRAQGFSTYESRLGLGIGALGFIAAGFAIAAPKPLLDFDVELAATLAGRRFSLVLRAFGFVDGDFENLAPAAEVARAALFVNVALLAATFVGTSFLPAFRFARMYAAMTRDAGTSRLTKLALHLNMLAPLAVAACWVPALTRTPLVNRLQLLTAEQFEVVRIYVVLAAVAVRIACFRPHLQHFLLEPRDTIAALVQRAGPVDGELLQTKVRLQFNYVPIVAVQYLAPPLALLTAAVMLARQTGTSLGLLDLLAWAMRVSPPAVGGAPLATDVTPPDLGGFRLGDELTRENAAKLVKGLAAFDVLPAEFYAATLGFVLWFFSVSLLAVSVAGLVYWKYAPGLSVDAGDAADAPRRNKETPKLLKNQLKSLKLKKH